MKRHSGYTDTDDADVAVPHKRCRRDNAAHADNDDIAKFELTVCWADQRGVYTSPGPLYKKISDLWAQTVQATDLCRRFKAFGVKITPKRTKAKLNSDIETTTLC